MDLQPSTTSTSILESYDRRQGTNNEGFEYESKITALLALRCIALPDTDDMWIGSNMDHIGDFDDIVLYRRTTDGRRLIYLIQLKHQEVPQNISNREFTDKNGKFSVLKYTKTFESLKQKLIKRSDNEHGVIQHLRQADEKLFVLYTNKGVDECYLLKQCDNGEVDWLDTRLTSNPSKFSLINSEFPQSLILLPNQVHINDAKNGIEKKITNLLGPQFNSSARACDKFANKFVEFIKAWSKGTRDKKYFTLTKQDVINKLSHILLDRYKYRFPYFNFRKCQINIWNRITKGKNITIVDSDDFVNEFLNQRMGSELNIYLKGSEESWEDELDEITLQAINGTDLEKNLLKMNSSHQKITVLDLYVSLWLTNKIPLLLEAKSVQDYESILEILKLSKFSLRVIIIKSASLQLDSNTVPTKYFNALYDLNHEDRLTILEMPIKLQNRPDHKLVDLIGLENVSILKLVTCKNVIQIIEGKLNVGNEYEALDEFHMDRCLSRVFLKNNVFKEMKYDMFIVKYSKNWYFRRTTSEEPSFPKNVMVVKESINLKDVESSGKAIHEIIVDGYGKLEWKRSLGTTKNILKYVIEDKIGLNVITANPGMGKSVFTDFMAVNAPKNTWVIKVILNKYTGHYKKIQNCSQIELLLFFAHQLLGKCDNLQLSKEIFQKCFDSNRILIVLDGYDEIVNENETEVIKITKRLHNNKLPLWITTRPNKKHELEETFSTIATTLIPLNQEEHIMLLTKYFTKLCSKPNDITQRDFDNKLKNYIRDLEAKIEENLGEFLGEFLEIPLHIRLLAEVFSADFENSLKTGDSMVNKFNLVELYEQFIRKKTDIVCQKFGQDWTTSRNFIEKSQKLFALKFLYSDRVKSLKIEEQLNEYYDSEEYKLSCLQREGIIVIEKTRNGEIYYYNINFTHRTFAEFLAAQWFSENIANPDIEVKCILKRILNDKNEVVVPKMFSIILAKGLLLHETVLSGNIEEIPELLKSNPGSVNDVDKGGRTVFHILATSLNDKQSEALIECIKKHSTINLRTTKDYVSGFTVLDHLISRKRFKIANKMCNINPNATITYSKLKKEILFHLCARNNYEHLFEAVLKYYVSRDILVYRVDKNTMIGPYCNLPREFLESQSKLKNYISKYGISTISEMFQFKTKINDSSVGDYYYDLNIACAFGTTENVEYLLSRGSEINSPWLEITPLHHATRHKRLDIVKLLIKMGAEVEEFDRDGRTALHYAVSSDITIELLSNSTNTSDSDMVGHRRIEIDWRISNSFVGQSASSDCGSLSAYKTIASEDSKLESWSHYFPLHAAAYHGDTDAIAELLSKGKSINEQDTNGSTPLHIAVQVNKLDCVIMLLLSDANANIQDNHGHFPLHAAAERGYVDIVSELLLKDKSINNKQDLEGNTPLHIALTGGNLDIANLLLSAGADTNLENMFGISPLHYAIENGYHKLIPKLLATGACINKQDKRGDTPLAIAVQHKKLDSVIMLLSNGADVNLDNKEGDSPLHIAAEYDHNDIILELLSKGANINKRNIRGATPLAIALQHRNRDSVRMLLSNGADVNLDNEEGYCPLHIAAEYDNNDIILGLLSKGANINKRNIYGATPLAIALFCSNWYTMTILLAQDANVNLDNNEGYSPLHIAAGYGKTVVIPKLLSKGANINKRDIRGDTPLAIALQHRNRDSVIMLLSNDADLNLDNHEGYPPLHFAAKEGSSELITKLLSKGANINQQGRNSDTPLSISIRYRNLDIAQMLLSNGADFDLKFEEFSLHYKTENSTELIFLLLSKGACINKQDNSGDTPLHLALMIGDLNSAKYLLSRGANNNLENYQGRSSLHCAAENCTAVIDELLQRGAKINKQDINGDTALHAAVLRRNLKSVRLLLSELGNCIMESNAQNSSMPCIAGSGCVNLHVNTQNKQGKTSLHYAVLLDAGTIVEVLLNHGADVNLQNGKGETPLHTILRDSYTILDDVTLKSRLSIVYLLLDKGADINIQDINGKTPLNHIKVNRSLQNNHYLENFFSEAKLLLATRGIDANICN